MVRSYFPHDVSLQSQTDGCLHLLKPRKINPTEFWKSSRILKIELNLSCGLKANPPPVNSQAQEQPPRPPAPLRGDGANAHRPPLPPPLPRLVGGPRPAGAAPHRAAGAGTGLGCPCPTLPARGFPAAAGRGRARTGGSRVPVPPRRRGRARRCPGAVGSGGPAVPAGEWGASSAPGGPPRPRGGGGVRAGTTKPI